MTDRRFAMSALLAGVLVGGFAAAPRSVAATSPPTCFGRPATIVGTQGPDHLRGTNGVDVIVGLGGNDVINGVGGGDFVCGGTGNDTIRNAKFVHGGPGADTVYSNRRKGYIYGDAGNDHLYAGDHGSTMYGGSGNDTLIGGADPDQLNGGAGDDVIRGAGSRDELSGGAGNDSIDGGPGVDEIEFPDATAGVRVDLARHVSTGQGHDSVHGIESATGTDFADQLFGDDKANFLLGYAGADIIRGRGGNDIISEVVPSKSTIFGGAGEDRFDPEVQSVTYPDGVVVDLAAGTARARFGPATFSKLSGIEDVRGTTGKDIIRGDAGPNVLEGYLHADQLYGRGGNDRLLGGFHDYGDGRELGDKDHAYGGSGQDICAAKFTVSC